MRGIHQVWLAAVIVLGLAAAAQAGALPKTGDLTEGDLPTVDTATADGWRCRIDGLIYDSKLDPNQPGRTWSLDIRGKCSPPPATPLAIAVACTITQALDDADNNLAARDPEFTPAKIAERLKRLSDPGGEWGQTLQVLARFRTQKPLPPVLHKVRMKVVSLLPGKVVRREVAPVEKSDWVDLGPGITGRITGVAQGDSIQPHVSFEYRVKTTPEWEKAPAAPVQIAKVQAVDEEGNLFTAGGSFDSKFPKQKTDDGWITSGTFIITRGKLSPDTPKPNKPLRALVVTTATDIRLVETELEFDKVDLTAWRGLLPRGVMTEKPPEPQVFTNPEGWHLQPVAMDYRAAVAVGMMGWRHEARADLAVSAPGAAPLRVLGGGFESIGESAQRYTEMNPFNPREIDVTPQAARSILEKPCSTLPSTSVRLVFPDEHLALPAARFSALVLVPEGLETAEVDTKPTPALADLKSGIKARVLDIQQAADKTLTVNMEVIVPGGKGGEAAFLGPQVLDMTAVDAAGRPLASLSGGNQVSEGNGPIKQYWYLALKPVDGNYARPARMRIRLAAAASLKTVAFDLTGLDLSNVRGTFRPEP